MEYGERDSVTSMHQPNELSNVITRRFKMNSIFFHCSKFCLPSIYQTRTQNIGLAIRRCGAKRVKKAQGDTEIFDSLDFKNGKLAL